MVFLRPYVVRDANRSASVTMDRYDYMRRAQAATQPGEHWALPDMQAPMLPAPGSAPSVSNNAYDLRPEQQAATMRRPPPATVESFAVRHRSPWASRWTPSRCYERAPLALCLGARPARRAVAACGAGAVDGQPAHPRLGGARDPALPRRYRAGARRRRGAGDPADGRLQPFRGRGVRHGRGRKRDRSGPAAAGHARGGGPAGGAGRRACDPHDQCTLRAGGARRRQRYPHRALRDAFRGALPRGRHLARCGVAAQGPACRVDFAHQDHGASGHRRKAPAAGRPHCAARGRTAYRRARVDLADRAWRTRRAAPAGQGGRAPAAGTPGHVPGGVDAAGPPDPAAARHRAGDGADRQRQDHHALCGAEPAGRRHQQHPDGRRPD
ncbi:hypothetical protein G6F57_015647 [Rhizopus arrhizus]|nr:hypothetical protein G6F57_015647 [Rhizopus arrhizus]